ncbi:MAG: hypothetical protein QOJ19_3737, partial [Acidimicrobiia bacterium]|nr:hypothetical protein [Acidimicrobiia bacterium]
ARPAANSVAPPLAAAAALLEAVGDTRDRIVFERLCLLENARPVELGRALDVGYERIRQLRLRAETRARAVAQEDPAFAEPVARLQHELGVAAPVGELDRALASLGLPPSSDVRTAVLTWLAGPYRRMPGRPGWVAINGNDLGITTRRLLGEDGGVHRTEVLHKQLVQAGMAEGHVEAWFAEQPVRVHEDVTVFLVGSLATVAERILSATGLAMSAEDCRCWCGDDAAPEPAWHEALRRDGRFVHVGGDRFELAEWGSEPVAVPSSPPRHDPRRPAPNGSLDDPAQPTLRVVVDDLVLAGAPGPVALALVERLGIAQGASRSVSTRYGPLSLSNAADGSWRGSLRPIALACGAAAGDVVLLRFDQLKASACVEVCRGAETVVAS